MTRHTPEERAQLRSLEEHPGYKVLIEGLEKDEGMASQRLENGQWEGVLKERGYLEGVRHAIGYAERYGHDPKGGDE